MNIHIKLSFFFFLSSLLCHLHIAMSVAQEVTQKQALGIYCP